MTTIPDSLTANEAENATPPLYYLQDARQFVGNSMLWWAKDRAGYVCDVRKAHVFTEDEINRHMSHTDSDRSDVPWLKSYIDERISHHIDMQHCERGEGGSPPRRKRVKP